MRIRNDGNATLPPFGICTQTGVSTLFSEKYYNVAELDIPAESGRGHQYPVINDSASLEVGSRGKGVSVLDRPRLWVAYDEADGNPLFGQMWGVDGGFKLRKDKPGFEIIGGAKNGRVFCQFIKDQSLYVQLQEDLDEADPDLQSGKQTATARVWKPDGSGDLETGSASQRIEVEIDNRWVDVSLGDEKNLWIKWSWYYLEWVPITGECP